MGRWKLPGSLTHPAHNPIWLQQTAVYLLFVFVPCKAKCAYFLNGFVPPSFEALKYALFYRLG